MTTPDRSTKPTSYGSGGQRRAVVDAIDRHCAEGGHALTDRILIAHALFAVSTIALGLGGAWIAVEWSRRGR